MDLLLFITVCCAMIASCFVEVKNRGSNSVAYSLWKFLSYYTVLSNLLVLLWSASILFAAQNRLGEFALNANVSAAVTFYIFTVGVANYLLFGWQNLPWLERISDLLVHAVTPILTFLFWVFFANKSDLIFSYLGYWLVFPISYAVYTIVHGHWTQFYPYEFTNVRELGAKRVVINTLALTIALIAGGSLFILLGDAIG